MVSNFAMHEESCSVITSFSVFRTNSQWIPTLNQIFHKHLSSVSCTWFKWTETGRKSLSTSRELASRSRRQHLCAVSFNPGITVNLKQTIVLRMSVLDLLHSLLVCIFEANLAQQIR
ncbi:hypothetical protein Mapa_011038 [Marchantia paleacea]|nr:hypothetical protein Mapa_011038 [Marchantia paleacea]